MNKVKKDDKEYEIPKVVFEVGYKDKEGKWHNTNRMSLDELPRAFTVLMEVYKWLLMKKMKNKVEMG